MHRLESNMSEIVLSSGSVNMLFRAHGRAIGMRRCVLSSGGSVSKALLLRKGSRTIAGKHPLG